MLQNNLNRIAKSLFPRIPILSELLLESIKIESCVIDGFYGTFKQEQNTVDVGSRYSEKRYAERILKEVTFKPNTFYWLIGIPSVIFIEEVLKRISPSSFLWIIEPCPEYFFKLGEKFEMNFMDKDNIAVVLHSDLDTLSHQVQEWLSRFISTFENIQMVSSSTYKNLDSIKTKDWEIVVSKELKEACMMAEMAISTMDVSAQNYFFNFHASLRNQDWVEIQRSLMDKPLIIIGAGPSLCSEYKTLKAIQNYVHIGVVDNSLRSLITEGIQPDFVFQVDWQKSTLDFYRDIEILPTTTLVTTPGAYSGVAEHWPGQLLFLQCPQLVSLSNGFVLKEVPNFFGTNVGMLAIQFANISKADLVCMVGYDMGAPMMTHFHPKVIGLQDIYQSVSRFWSTDKYNYDYLKKHRETITVKNQQGEETWTALSIEKGRKDLETYFEKEKACERFINCSKYSVGFKGINFKALNEIKFDHSLNKKILKLDKHCLNYERYGIFLEDKLKQVKAYFKLMHEIYTGGIALSEIYDSKKSSAKQDFLIKEYQELLDRLFKSGAGWIENLMVEMDRRLIILHKRDNLLLEDLDSNEEKLIGKVRQFVKHYPNIEKHRQWLTTYMKSLKEKNKKAGLE
jgi:hypothetical protein